MLPRDEKVGTRCVSFCGGNHGLARLVASKVAVMKLRASVLCMI